ncbi:hypothetical protein [Bradyrhizobium jicamae]|uniref:hypothetical protein n=1 Tax=Bradyrhizobium jicamae TaxID=280332 RepID=UPI001BAC8CB2|nr:hypothetical protein [Bradyrhizobium jicamae]MBR0939321.1 hypothetical protein [Bradyrhizobium jicamae]
MNPSSPLQARFLVRQGAAGWMLYDRKRKGPAMMQDGNRAEKLTKEEAENLQERLMKAVLIYVDRTRKVGEADYLRVFGTENAAETWLEENDPLCEVFE